MKTLILLITLITATSLVRANEIIPIWNNSAKANIQDLEIMPGGDEFILTTHEATIEVRSTEDGSLVREYVDQSNLFVAGDIEFTPDSNRIILGVSGLLQILDLETFERLGYFAFGPDTIARGFSNLVVDPIRPLVYATINGFEKTSGNNNPIGKVQAYNYETMKPVRNLTEYGNNRYEALAISSDGKYLASINDGLKAYLKIWDLETNKLIVNKSLFDGNSEDRCEAYDIYFSEKDRDVVYFSGMFSKKVHLNDKGSGLFKFNMADGTRELMIPDETYGAWDLILFDNESRVANSTFNTLSMINLNTNKLEYYNIPPENIYSKFVRYNHIEDVFISGSGNKTSKFIYDRETSIEQEIEEEIIISPNPTHSTINLSIECIQPDINYSIYNMEGLLISHDIIENQEGNFTIDFTSYPSGVYFLSFMCNNKLNTYKIVKEG